MDGFGQYVGKDAQKDAMHVFGTRRRKARRRAAQLAHGIFDLTTVEPSSSNPLSPEPILLATDAIRHSTPSILQWRPSTRCQ